ncbi:E3 ubiquitin-protein ligase At1g63170 [Ricinus communis]|uniref:RING-type E3 ubiquitin transferase n=1 Tax=Ricinus communis TaxID=3988 RepID=B9RDL6_RICCO|nr:E3 ubiquitin-protein ligase At1g63170 [Ricinus communis]EEF50474.1 cleavage and polyadenylation specificity factor, putative [Ricinus communis]|eukprot:XP_002511805.1 E3 ubiquitin-protein ligase At1g63170 [Ricinus communis]
MASPQSDSVDMSPLLTHSIADHLLRSRRILRRQPPPFRGAAARLLRRASSRRMMLREPSVRVRENAAEQLEERQTDWAYSKPIIFLDVLWNLAFVGIGVVVLGLSVKEEPQLPLRVWIIGYSLQCLFHIGCVIFEYKRRLFGTSARLEASDSTSVSESDGGDSVDDGVEQRGNDGDTCVVKQLESANTMFSFIWWIVGFYWVTAGGQNLTNDSPQLYWLCITFLAFDVIFVIICIAVACLIGLAICCCLPCIIGILYAMTDREGATQEEIEQLPMYKFRRIGDFEKVNADFQATFGGMMTECEIDTPTERRLSHEDAECCICLSAYEDGTELRQLPCQHHFHSTCIDKWLYINATCPLCKLNILKASNHIAGGEV